MLGTRCGEGNHRHVRLLRKLRRRILRAPADSGLDFFQFLLGGEVFAAPLLAAYAKSVGFDSEADMLSPHFNVTQRPGLSELLG